MSSSAVGASRSTGTASRRVALGFLLLVFGALAVAIPTALPAAAQDGDTAVLGTLKYESGPVAGVTITVEDSSGNVVGEATSADDGSWRVALPDSGEYVVRLDEATLPEGVGLRAPDRNPLEVSVGSGQQRTVVFILGESTLSLTGPLRRLPQSLVNGLKLGLIIAMTAVGLSLIFGTTGQINFAHGELVTLGAVVAWYLNVVTPGIHLVPAAIITVGVGGLSGGALELGLWRPVRRRNPRRFQLLVISVGLSLVLRHLILIFFGSRGRPYGSYTVQDRLSLGPLSMTPRDVSIIVLSLLVLIALGLMLQRTRVGKAMRAVSDNIDLAESSGVNVRWVVLMVWILGGALAALGGVFLGLVENVTWDMGFRLLLLMFSGVVLGGLGTAYGTIVGSIIVGLIMELSTLVFPNELKAMWAMLVLVLILIVRPQGILGVKERVG